MPDGRKYWLWVTTREIAKGIDEDKEVVWTWTCDEKTEDGDLILLYLNSKGKAAKMPHKSAFCYLMQARGTPEDGILEPNWPGWGCEAQVLFTFNNPVRYKDLELDPVFKDWDAYKKMNFQGKSFPIPENIWNKLDDMAMVNNPDYLGYQNLIRIPIPSIESIVESDLDSILAEELFEGKKGQRFITYYERNPKLRSEAIRFHGFKCMACGFDFAQKYGERGSNYIEVHHLKSVSSLGDETRVDPKREMTVVCSNCHRMIHRKKDEVLSLEELRKIIR